MPFTYAKISGVGLTATKIVVGVPSDLTPLKLGARVAGYLPYYVQVTVTNESGADLAFSTVSGLYGALPDGTRAQDVIIFGTFAKCSSATAKGDFKNKGASYTTCLLALAQPATKVTGVLYSGGLSKTTIPNTDYSADPILWK